MKLFTKFKQFEACLEIIETEPTINKQTVINCFEQLKLKTKKQPTSDDFLYICLCVLSVSTDDTVQLDSFKCIFEDETISYNRLLTTLDHINPIIYSSRSTIDHPLTFEIEVN